MLTRFTINGSNVYVDSVPWQVAKKLEKATRYRPADVIYDPRFKYKHWDGWERLFKDGRFPLGLLSRVMDVWKSEGVPYEVKATNMQDGLPLDYRFVGELRPYQETAVEEAIRAGRGILRAPTGSGKTLIAIAIASRLNLHTVVLVPTVDLLLQFAEQAAKHLDGKVGKLGGGVIDPQPFTVSTIMTMARILNKSYETYEYAELDDADDTNLKDQEALNEWVRGIGTLIIDEAQILGAKSVFNVADAIPVRHKFGVSASPWRDDGCDLLIEAATGRQFYQIGAKILVEGGFLVPPVVRTIPVGKNVHPEPLDGNYNEVYSKKIVNNDARNKLIADITEDLLKRGYIVLVLVKQIKHGKKLEKLIKRSVFLSGSLDGDIRATAFNAMKEGYVSCVIATSIADMGLDIPNLSALVLAGGGKSSTRHLQRIGRICRPFPGKTHGLVVDLDDTIAHEIKYDDGDTRKRKPRSWFGEHINKRKKITDAEWGDQVTYLDF